MKLYLGTNYGHGSAAAVVSNSGELLFAVEEGRLRDQQDCSAFPELALSQIEQFYGRQICGWAEGWNPHRRLWMKGVALTARFGWRDSTYLTERLGREAKRYVAGLRGYEEWRERFGRPTWLGHHAAHAYSLIPWGLPRNSLVVVSDYIGEDSSLTSFYWNGREMRSISSVLFPHSLGAAFHQLATHLGFKGRTGPGKLMALAGLGEPKWVAELSKLVAVRRATLRFDLSAFPIWHRRKAWTELGKRAPPPLSEEIRASEGCWQAGVHLAASTQKWFTATTWRYIASCVDYARNQLGLDVRTLGLAGGAALNCQANGEFVRHRHQLGIADVTVSPWSDDSGTAIGAAVWFALRKNQNLEIKQPSPFLGPPASKCSGRPDQEAIRACIGLLSQGRVVALVDGRLEFGPRALGGRCLLADPRRIDIRKRLNDMKGRPPFMPFAPVVLERNFHNLFDGEGSTNMAWTVPIRTEARAAYPGMDHASGEARVQILPDRNDSILGDVLSEWQKMTGSSVLLLTSLNGAGEAIPDTLEKAKRVATRLGAEGLLTNEWQLLRGNRGERAGNYSGSIAASRAASDTL